MEKEHTNLCLFLYRLFFHLKCEDLEIMREKNKIIFKDHLLEYEEKQSDIKLNVQWINEDLSEGEYRLASLEDVFGLNLDFFDSDFTEMNINIDNKTLQITYCSDCLSIGNFCFSTEENFKNFQYILEDTILAF